MSKTPIPHNLHLRHPFHGMMKWRVMISWSALNITWVSQWSAAIKGVGLLNKALKKWPGLLFKISNIGKEESKESNYSIFIVGVIFHCRWLLLTRFSAWFSTFCIVFQDWMMQSFWKKSCQSAGSVYLAYSQTRHTQERNHFHLDSYVVETCALLYKAEYMLSIPVGESSRGLSGRERNRYRIWCEIITHTT